MSARRGESPLSPLEIMGLDGPPWAPKRPPVAAVALGCALAALIAARVAGLV